MSRFIRKILDDNRSLVNTVLLVSLTSIVYIYPFGSPFRFTLAIVLLTAFLLYFELRPFKATIITGLGILLMRTVTDYLIGSHSCLSALMTNLPSMAYYVSFGMLFQVLGIRRCTDNVLLLLILLSVTDIISNIVELMFRAELVSASLAVVFPSIVVVAVVRAVLAVIAYYALKQYQTFILANDRAERYVEQTLMVAKLKSELFYLEKSSQDIENVMEQAYWLYKRLNGAEPEQPQKMPPPEQALAVAREIHEVKKDYYRVISGIENILQPSSRAQHIHFSEILYIIEENTSRYLSMMEKTFSLSYEFRDDFITDKHYTLVSILDNLLMNAIEACGDHGIISVIQSSSAGMVYFCVQDNGIGIDPQELELIFNPGYSTKFSPRTGKISTGLGLSHVKNYVELLGGTIKVESELSVGTKFYISLPADSIFYKKEQVQ